MALLHPVAGWLALNLAFLGWHIPGAFELALRSETWHEVEHACFFFTAILFWWTVIQPWPSREIFSRWKVIPYLLTADFVNTGLSAFLAFSGRVFYPSYADRPSRFLPLSPQRPNRRRRLHVGLRLAHLPGPNGRHRLPLGRERLHVPAISAWLFARRDIRGRTAQPSQRCYLTNPYRGTTVPST